MTIILSVDRLLAKDAFEGSMNPTSSHSEAPFAAERRRAERRTSPSLAAYHWKGSIPRQNSVRDISATGAFLVTQDRWEPGEIIALSLQRHGPPKGRTVFPFRPRRFVGTIVVSRFPLSCPLALIYGSGRVRSRTRQNRMSLKTSCANFAFPRPSPFFRAYRPTPVTSCLGCFTKS